jgi:hypothetical protein
MAVVPAFQASSNAEAVLSFFSDTSLNVDISKFSLRQLMNYVGKHCEQLTKSCTTLKHIILKLRNMSVTLEKAVDLDLAIQWISEGYEEPPAPKVVKQYANALKGFLRMPPLMIPENPILTGSLPKWMFFPLLPFGLTDPLISTGFKPTAGFVWKGACKIVEPAFLGP